MMMAGLRESWMEWQVYFQEIMWKWSSNTWNLGAVYLKLASDQGLEFPGLVSIQWKLILRDYVHGLDMWPMFWWPQ